MKPHYTFLFLILSLTILAAQPAVKPPHTTVSIVGNEFFINGQPTYAGREWNGHKIQGLLLNARVI
jgi:hypothetical protein